MKEDSIPRENTRSQTVVHIGDYLRQERESRKISIEKISQKTKINLNILKSLEINDFKSLPSPAYVKGFVLSYSRVLGLSPEDVITKLEYSYLTILGKPFPALNHSKNNEAIVVNPDLKDPATVLEEEKKIENRKKLIIPLAVGFTFIFGMMGLYKLLTGTIKKEIKSTQTTQEERSTPPVEETTSAEAETSLAATPEQVPATEATVAIAQPENQPTTPVATPAPEVVKQDVKPTVQPEVKKTAPVVETKPAEVVADKKVEETKVEEKAQIDLSKRVFPPKDFRKISLKLFAFQEADETTQALLTDDAKSKFNADLENVFITAFEGNTWLSYQVDGKSIESVSLKKGENLLLQGNKILLFFGNVKATRIFYQNKLIDAPTPTGFKSLIFPEKETRNHVLPLFPKANNGNLYTSDEYIKRMKEEEKKLSN